MPVLNTNVQFPRPTFTPASPASGGVSAGAKISRTLSAQTIANTEITQLEFDTLDFDDGDFYSASSPSQLTVPSGLDGTYLILCGVRFNANETGARVAAILVNGSQVSSFTVNAISGGAASFSQCASVENLDAGDAVTSTVYQSSGSSLDVDGNAGNVLSLQKL